MGEKMTRVIHHGLIFAMEEPTSPAEQPSRKPWGRGTREAPALRGASADTLLAGPEPAGSDREWAAARRESEAPATGRKVTAGRPCSIRARKPVSQFLIVFSMTNME